MKRRIFNLLTAIPCFLISFKVMSLFVGTFASEAMTYGEIGGLMVVLGGGLSYLATYCLCRFIVPARKNLDIVKVPQPV